VFKLAFCISCFVSAQEPKKTAADVTVNDKIKTFALTEYRAKACAKERDLGDNFPSKKTLAAVDKYVINKLKMY